jgi:hypothetical protein
MAAASAAQRARHFLVIGPWDHAGTRTPQLEVGGLKFGAASQIDMNDLHRQWYDWTLKGAKQPEFLQSAVTWYITGAEQWRRSASLAAVTAGERTLYLGSSGTADDPFGGGRLQDASAAAGSDRYTYDPRDLSTQAQADATDVAALTDQRGVLLGNGRQLVYHSAPFTRATDIAGFFRLQAWIEIDQRDTDVVASVYELRPDGTSIFLAGDQLRARYRQDATREQPATPGAVEAWDFDQFTFIARTLGVGSRLRLVLGPKDSPFDQRNYNSGKAVADETPADAKPVLVRLHHGAGHESLLRVPLAAAGDSPTP